MTQATAPTRATAVDMTHRQILEALSGLLLGMFVAILSSHGRLQRAAARSSPTCSGGQSAYTWVVTATLLATTATTPIWGKLADLFSKKLLVQIALVDLRRSARCWPASPSPPGSSSPAGCSRASASAACTALVQIDHGRDDRAARARPVQRLPRRACMAVGTVGGPLIGGVIVDTDWLGWRWCFYVGVPFAVVALVVLQKTLHLPVVKRDGEDRLPRAPP